MPESFGEDRLIERLRAIEALHSGATTAGERVAADRARQRILERLAAVEREDPPVELRFSMPDMWSRKVFIALLRRYGIQPYRYRGQRHTSVVARLSKRFVDETLWPEFQELVDTLNAYLAEVTDRVVSQVLHHDVSEAGVVEQPKQLELGTEQNGAGGKESESTGAANRQRNRKKRQRAKRRKRGRRG